jgi:hypothetical protein
MTDRSGDAAPAPGVQAPGGNAAGGDGARLPEADLAPRRRRGVAARLTPRATGASERASADHASGTAPTTLTPEQALSLSPAEAEQELVRLAPVVQALKLAAARGERNGEAAAQPPDRGLTAAQAAARLGWPVKKFYYHGRKGDLPFVRQVGADGRKGTGATYVSSERGLERYLAGLSR